MSDGGLADLYQEVILEHSRHPRNFGPADDANRSARGNNPLCGDRVTIHLKLDGDVIEDARFEARGCAISLASASMMTEMVKGKTEEEVRDLFRAVSCSCYRENRSRRNGWAGSAGRR